MKKNLTIITITTLISSTAFAFNSVTEILPSGKILICKDSGQVKKGNTVEVYTRTNPKSSSDYTTTKTREFKLPAAGQKINLTHKDFHSKGKNSAFHEEELGSAVILDGNLEGEERISYSLDKNRSSTRIEKRYKITQDEAEKIQNECLVALPEKGLQLKEKAAVSWE